MSACPSEDQLSDLAGGSLPAPESEALHGHIRGCVDCQQALAALAESLPPGNDDKEPELFPGSRVGRFEVLARVGSGSMGAVWSARDTELGRVVALKTLRSSSSNSPALQRLQREAQAMARLSHPNVVTVFDVIAHGEQVFLAMELVFGGTLREWLQARPRTLDEILSAFVHAGQGLAAAHAAGLVHRDFKPDNVLVGEDGRVRVNDFGLARPAGTNFLPPGVKPDPRALSSSPDPELRLTASGALVGTPAYMAPEQMRGEPADARSDVFGFCAALYEALYGERAFAGRSLEELQRRAESNEVSPAPKSRVPSWLRQILLRGLRALPAERWSSMDELLAAIARGRKSGARRRLQLGGVALAAIALAVVAGTLFSKRHRTVAPAGTRRSVAMISPRNASGLKQAAWISSALTDMIGNELVASEGLRLVPAKNVVQALADLKLSSSAEPAPSDLHRLYELTGADLVVEGAYQAAASGALSLELRLLDARSGKLIDTAVEEEDQAHLFDLAAREGTRLREALGVRAPSQPVSSSYPRDPEAARLLAEGQAALRALEAKSAAQLLVQADARAPGNPRILGALAEAYAANGETAKEREAATRALAVGGELSREERLRLERLENIPEGSDWKRALEISQALATFFPDDIEYALQLQNDLYIAGRYAEAFAVIDRARKFPPPEGQDPRLDVRESAVARATGDLPRAVAAAKRAIESSRALGVRRGLVVGFFALAEAQRRQGEVAEAAKAYDEAEQGARELGDQRIAGISSLMHGTIDADQGDLPTARRRFETAIASFREMGNLDAEGSAQHNLGILLRWMRRDAEALQAQARAIEIAEKLGEPKLLASATLAQGDLLFDQGDLDGAGAAYAKALEIRRTRKLASDIAGALRSQAWLALERGEVARARSLCQEAQQSQATDATSKARQPLCLALVELADDHPKLSEPLAAEAAKQSEATKNADSTAHALAVHALALLSQGNAAEAARSAARAKAQLALTKSYIERTDVGIAAALTLPSLADSVAAAAEVLAEAKRTGSFSDVLHARLLLGTLRWRARDPGARAELSALSKEAASRGFGFVARRARIH